MKKTAPKISSDSLRARLKLKSFEERANFFKKHPHASKFLNFKGLNLGKIREHSAKLISTSALAGALLLNPPTDLRFLPSPQEILDKLKLGGNKNESDTEKIDKRTVLLDSLNTHMPQHVGPLSREEEKFLEQIFKDTLNITARATLEGEHLNTTYGFIGAEQHLRRYPGDTLQNHDGGVDIQRSGMAPGLGAWGYFADSKSELTPYLVEKEKWYAVVQTLYLPDWARRQPYLKDWYKFRKVVIINKLNGNAVVADVADSGPAAWTGKHFGGSPEVMQALGGNRYKKGAVIVFFVDDPENKIPLGPVEYNS